MECLTCLRLPYWPKNTWAVWKEPEAYKEAKGVLDMMIAFGIGWSGIFFEDMHEDVTWEVMIYYPDNKIQHIVDVRSKTRVFKEEML